MTVFAGEDAVSALAAEAKKADVTGFAASGKTITLTFGDGTTKQVTTQDTTYTAGTGIAISNTGVISQTGTVYHFMGSCAVANLPSSPASGDVWNLTDASSYGPAGTNVAWTGSAWDAMGGVVDVPVQSVSGTAPITASTSNKAVTVGISAASGTAAGSMSSAHYTKLEGIATGAQVNVIESVSGTAPITASKSGKAVTVSIGAASGTAAGSMSSAHYTKLEGIAAGAEVNQNAFSNVKVGSTTIAADAETDTLTIVAGDNVTLTPDATNDKLTIAATDTTYGDATTSAHGLMTAAMVTKLNGIATGANNYTHPSYTDHESGLYKVTVDATGHVSDVTAVAKTDITALGIPAQDTTYSDATTSAHGLMTAADKTKLDGIATGAEVNQNAFSNVKVGSTTIAADAETDTLTIVAGDNVTLTPDATNDKLTIAATDTTYGDATTSAHGLMTAAMVTKLNGIATGAEVNQNAFANVKVGDVTVAADSKSDTLELVAGRRITLTPDATNDKVTIHAAAMEMAAESPIAVAEIVEESTGDEESIVTGYTVGHLASGVTANTYGTTATSALAPGFGGTFAVPGFTVNATGHVTAAGSHNVTMPSSAATQSAAGLMSAADKAKLDGMLAPVVFCTCDTAAGTAAKVGTPVGAGFALETGAVAIVLFMVTNTAAVANLTLNVGGTGAKSIKYRGGNVPAVGTLAANRTYAFVYDGANWQLVGDFDTNTTYTNVALGQGYATCTTAAATAAKAATLSSYALTVGGIVAVKFTYAVPASATLNVNSKGAKAIHYMGTAITAGVIEAGDLATFIYNGTNYVLLAVDHCAAASASRSGLMTTAMVTKLNGVATGATADTAMTAARAVELWQNA